MKNLNLLFILFSFLFFQTSIFSQGGDLDPTFNNGNIASAELNINGFGPWGGGDVQSDGKIVAYIVDGTESKLVRFNVDGTIDTSFGTIVSNEGGRILKVIDEDKILMGTSIGKVEKYNADGSLDASFDNSNHSSMYVYGIDVQSDGKILAVGRRQTTEWNDIIARYNSDGSVDTSFGANGEVELNIFESDWARSVIALSDGSILLQGSSLFNMPYVTYFAKLDSDGNLDVTFGSDGILLLTSVSNDNVSYSSVELNNGQIIVTGGDGINGYKIFIAKLNPNGSLDNTFGTNGVVLDSTFTSSTTETFGSLNCLIQDDGKILAYGSYEGESSNNQTSFAIKRYNADGSIDTNFGFDGLAIATLDGVDAQSFSLALDSDGNIIQIGNARYSNGITDIIACRYLCCMDVGVLDFEIKNQSFLIYPNPIENSTTLSFSLEGEKELDIFLTDMSGKIVKQFFTKRNFIAGEHQLDLQVPSTLSTGSYFLTIQNNQIPISVKVFKK